MDNYDLKGVLHKEMSRKEFFIFSMLAIGSAFGFVGLIRELSSHAATATATIEPEVGMVAGGGAKVVNDTAASGGKAVRFAAATVPPPAASGTIYGVNVQNNNWAGGTNNSWAIRGDWFGKIPVGRGWYTSLPSGGGSFNANGTDWGFAGGTYGQKRANVNFTYSAPSVANGSQDAAIIQYINSIPAGWTIYLCFFTEYNLHFDTTNTVDAFKAAFIHLGQLCAAHSPDGRAVPTICQSTFGWQSSYAPTASQMPANTLFLIDAYNNPSGQPTGYKAYGTTYSSNAVVLDNSYNSIVNDLGYQHWGIGEFNSPQRVAPALPTLDKTLGWGPLSPYDISGAERAAWITSFCNYMQAKPNKPDVVLLWEGGNGSWNQYFTSAGFANLDDGTASNPGAHYQGWPITIDKTPMVNAYKAFINKSA